MLEKFKEVFSNIEINEDQAQALNNFFEEYSRSIEKKIKIKYESAFSPEKNGYIKASEAEKAFELFKKESEMAFEAYKSDTEKAFALFEKDAELAFEAFEKDAELAFEAFEGDSQKAFELFEEDSKQAFGLFVEDSSKAFDMFNQDVITEHSEKMAQIIEDLYPTLEEKVRQDLLASDEFKIYESFKHQIKPYLINESETEHSLRKQVDFLKAELESLNEEKEVSERDQTIEDLVSDLPAKEMKIVKNYIEKAKNIDEIFERYNLAMELFNIKGSLQNLDEDKEDSEDMDEYNESEENDEDFDGFDDDFSDNEEINSFMDDEDYLDRLDEDEDDDFEDMEQDVYQEESEDRQNVIFESNTIESKKENKKFNTVEDAIIESVFGKK